MKTRNLIVLPLVFAAVGLGCNRNGKSTISSMTISIPYVQNAAKRQGVSKVSGSTTCTNRIMINVTGPAISPPLPPYIWQSNNNNNSDTCPTPPSSASFNVPSGSAILVQALLIDQDNSGNMNFLYDSASTTPTAGQDDAVTLNPVAINVSVGQGQIVGRYLALGDSTGKTGLVNLVYAPPGQPGLIVDTEEIFGGWLSVFSPTGSTQFSYVFEDGTTLFTSGANSSSNLLGTPSVGSNLLVNVPASYQNWGGGGSGNTNASSVTIAGFFGAGNTSGQIACYHGGTDTIADLYASDDTTPMSWIGNGTPSGVSPAFQAYIGSGGSKTGSCPSSAPTLNVPTPALIYMDEQQLGSGGGGNSNLLGFFGPFVQVPPTGGENTSPQYLTASFSSPTVTLNWTYQPTAVAGINGAKGGVDVFYLMYNNTTNPPPTSSGNPPYQSQNGNGIACGPQLVSQYGFTQFTSASSPAVPGIPTMGSYAMTYPITLATYDPSLFAAVVCPYRFLADGITKSYFTSAAQIQPENGGGGLQYNLTWAVSATSSNNSTVTAYTTANFTQAAGSSAGVNGCKAYDVGISPTPTSSVQLNISDNGVGGSYHANFYTSSGCSSGTTTTLTIPPSTTHTTVWVSSTGIMSGGFDNVNVNMNSGGGPGPSAMPLSVVLGMVTGSQSNPYMGNMQWLMGGSTSANLVQGTCNPVVIELNGSGTAQTFLTSTTVTPTVTGVAGSFYSDPACTTIAPTINIPAGESVGVAFFSPTAVGGGGSIAATSNQAGLTLPSMSMNVGSSMPTQVSVQPQGGGSFSEGLCQQVQFNFMNSVGAMINGGNPSASVNLSLSSPMPLPGNVQFYSDHNCTLNASMTFSGTANFGTMLYLMTPNGTTAMPIEFDITGTVASNAALVTSYSDLTNPGNGFSTAGLVGNPQLYQLTPPGSLTHGQCYPVYAYLQSGSMAATYAGTVSVTATLGDTGTTGGLVFTSQSNCTSNFGGASAQTTTIPAGVSSAVFWVDPGTSAMSTFCGINYATAIITITNANGLSQPYGPATICPNL